MLRTRAERYRCRLHKRAQRASGAAPTGAHKGMQQRMMGKYFIEQGVNRDKASERQEAAKKKVAAGDFNATDYSVMFEGFLWARSRR